MSETYCWDKDSKHRYKVLGVSPDGKNVTYSTLDGLVGRTVPKSFFDSRFKIFSDKTAIKLPVGVESGLKCECGVDKTYGDAPASWHADYCPKGVKDAN